VCAPFIPWRTERRAARDAATDLKAARKSRDSLLALVPKLREQGLAEGRAAAGAQRKVILDRLGQFLRDAYRIRDEGRHPSNAPVESVRQWRGRVRTYLLTCGLPASDEANFSGALEHPVEDETTIAGWDRDNLASQIKALQRIVDRLAVERLPPA
jgi:hypothetical protein